jgi:hypothetical protein
MAQEIPATPLAASKKSSVFNPSFAFILVGKAPV